MPDKHLETYLSEHTAGAAAALELLEHLEAAHAGTPTARFLAELRADIEADRRELEALMGRLHVSESRPRKATAWLAEKAAELKLWLDDRSGGRFRLFESLEALSLGIEGKRLLWRSLAAASADVPEVQGPDYGLLEKRAEEQRGRVEAARLEAARVVLGGKS